MSLIKIFMEYEISLVELYFRLIIFVMTLTTLQKGKLTGIIWSYFKGKLLGLRYFK